MLSDPDILILNETTSHVGNKTEVLIQDRLSDLVEDRTTIAIVHRLSPLANHWREQCERGPSKRDADRKHADETTSPTGAADAHHCSAAVTLASGPVSSESCR